MLSQCRDRVKEIFKQGVKKENDKKEYWEGSILLNSVNRKIAIDALKDYLPKKVVSMADRGSLIVSEQQVLDITGHSNAQLIKVFKEAAKKKGWV